MFSFSLQSFLPISDLSVTYCNNFILLSLNTIDNKAEIVILSFLDHLCDSQL